MKSTAESMHGAGRSSRASCIANLPSGDCGRISLREVEIGYLFCGQEPRKQQRAGSPESSPRGLMVGSISGRPRRKRGKEENPRERSLWRTRLQGNGAGSHRGRPGRTQVSSHDRPPESVCLSTGSSIPLLECCLRGHWFPELADYTGMCAEQGRTSVRSGTETLGQKGKGLWRALKGSPRPWRQRRGQRETGVLTVGGRLRKWT